MSFIRMHLCSKLQLAVKLKGLQMQAKKRDVKKITWKNKMWVGHGQQK